ncbi:hypothetical protein [Nonomuraea jabiensis]|uniref:Uncharacterized protein n=1 Tax=Nonomuraea jabiensis TaxID=882448 RepID=A0A7W9FYZ3_9ACTN|nr:hypothetical protein [Nonomuraea jabiensis]MBB5774069.1 hypothetical protein [Nonomuraea jabiensis]
MLELDTLTPEHARLWLQEEGEPVPEDGTRDLRQKIIKMAGSSSDPDWTNARAAATAAHQALLDFAEFARHEPHGLTDLENFIRARRRFQNDVLNAVRQLMNTLGKVVDCPP